MMAFVLSPVVGLVAAVGSFYVVMLAIVWLGIHESSSVRDDVDELMARLANVSLDES